MDHRGDQRPGPGPVTARRTSARRCCRRSTGCSTRWTGGPEGNGWPLGRSVQAHEVNAALARIPGVDMAEEISVQLFPADPATGRRGSAVQRLPLAPTALVFSYEHQVRVRQ